MSAFDSSTIFLISAVCLSMASAICLAMGFIASMSALSASQRALIESELKLVSDPSSLPLSYQDSSVMRPMRVTRKPSVALRNPETMSAMGPPLFAARRFMLRRPIGVRTPLQRTETTSV